MGAWIETKKMVKLSTMNGVAPHVGAWIETLVNAVTSGISIKSHPTWVRGLKHLSNFMSIFKGVSHPTWVRGLKQSVTALKTIAESRTPRGCVD